MSDHLRRDHAIRDALSPWYPGQAPGTVARHLTTLAALVSGIVGSKRTHLPQIATQVPDGTKPESRVKRLARGGGNDTITADGSFVPSAAVLLRQLALQTLVLSIDGRVVGRGGVALMLPVVYQGRALPLAWLVRPGQKGHFPADLHVALVQQVHQLSPPGASEVFLGDGECDGITLQQTGQASRWSSVVRTGSHITVLWDGDRWRCDTVGACSKPGTLVALREVRVTAAAYGPIMLRCCGAQGYKDPLSLRTHMASAAEACRVYAKRFRIETFFSDQKSRGVHLHHAPLAAPTRLARLWLAACLASLWIIYVGGAGSTTAGAA